MKRQKEITEFNIKTAPENRKNTKNDEFERNKRDFEYLFKVDFCDDKTKLEKDKIKFNVDALKKNKESKIEILRNYFAYQERLAKINIDNMNICIDKTDNEYHVIAEFFITIKTIFVTEYKFKAKIVFNKYKSKEDAKKVANFIISRKNVIRSNIKDRTIYACTEKLLNSLSETKNEITEKELVECIINELKNNNVEILQVSKITS